MSKGAPYDAVRFSDWITLLGFFPEQEALQMIRSQGFEIADDQEWLEKIRAANLAVNRISGRVGLKPRIEPLDDRFAARITTLEAEPTFQEHMAGMKSKRFALLELASIHCFQTQLNAEYIKTLVESAPEPEDTEATVKFCLPTKEERPKTQMLASVNPTSNTFSAVTENLDLRIVGNVQGEDQVSGRKFFGFAYGFGLPQISVVEYKGLFMIKNGYHRAYALLKKGHKFLPCLLLSTDSFQSTGAQLPGFFSIDLLTSDKCPVLSDFGTEAVVLVPRRRLRVMVSIHAEIQVVPV